MPHRSRYAYLLIVFDSRTQRACSDTIDARKVRIKQKAEACDLRVHRVVMHDLAGDPDELADIPPELMRIGHLAARKRWVMIVDLSSDQPGILKFLSKCLEEDVEVFSEDALDRDVELLRQRNRSRTRARERAIVGPEAAVGGKKPSAGRDTCKSRWAAAGAHTEAWTIRKSVYAQWFKQARAEGPKSSQEISDWLNAKGAPTTRGLKWTRTNVQKVMTRIASEAPAADNVGGLSEDEPLNPLARPKPEPVSRETGDDVSTLIDPTVVQPQAAIDPYEVLFSEAAWRELSEHMARNEQPPPLSERDKWQIEEIRKELDSIPE